MKKLSVLARDVAGAVGAVLISWGVEMIYPPAGMIVAGAFLLAGSLLLARADDGGA